MNRRQFVAVTFLGVAAHLTSFSALAFADNFPSHNDYVLPGQLTFSVEILDGPDAGDFLGKLVGPTAVHATNAYVHPNPPYRGNKAIDTTINSMEMEGTVGTWSASWALMSPPESLGFVADDNPLPNLPFPAESFFDIFFELEIEGMTGGELELHNKDPLRMAATIYEVPANLVETPYVGSGWIPIANYTPRDPFANIEDSPLKLYNENDEWVASLRDPVLTPEPASMTLLGIGLLGLLAFAWRRRRRKAG